jgi:uncharacterized protein (DUF58 family)
MAGERPTRPTRAGLALVLAAVVLALAGWVFGQPELTVLGAAAAAIVALAALYVRSSRLRLEIRRTARPARVSVDDPCQIVLRVRNVGRVRSPVLRLRDEVGPFGTATLQLAPLPNGATRDAVYSFPTRRRGIHRVGPLTVEIEDPFGLVRASHPRADADAVIVLPRIHRLTPLPPAPGEEPEFGVRALASNSTVDEEFAALRPYEQGDDIRRVHWRSTARLGYPVVRQFDQPWQHRTTVLLDVRAAAHDAESFERSVSAAASVIVLGSGRGEFVRLVTTDGRDSGFVGAWDRADELLDRLAGIEPTGQGSLTATIAQLGRTASGRLVACVGALDAVEHAGLARGSRRFGLAVLVASSRVVASPGPGPVLVTDDGSVDLPRAWDAAAASLRTVVGAPR